MSTLNTFGWVKLLELQEAVENTISHSFDFSEPVKSTVWDIYYKGETVGMIRGRFEIATHMKDIGYSRVLISHLTQLPEVDLAMWEEAQQASVDQDV